MLYILHDSRHCYWFEWCIGSESFTGGRGLIWGWIAATKLGGSFEMMLFEGSVKDGGLYTSMVAYPDSSPPSRVSSSPPSRVSGSRVVYVRVQQDRSVLSSTSQGVGSFPLLQTPDAVLSGA